MSKEDDELFETFLLFKMRPLMWTYEIERDKPISNLSKRFLRWYIDNRHPLIEKEKQLLNKLFQVN
jgi:hypothetical protein